MQSSIVARVRWVRSPKLAPGGARYLPKRLRKQIQFVEQVMLIPRRVAGDKVSAGLWWRAPVDARSDRVRHPAVTGCGVDTHAG
ncbi:hypothetical protein EVAR_66157_1 [Eumeta japonica]|uniref:Uncharacterized protein n=1 Tax=Eumeta variegata TaxID=151549 RepID=A0A4C2A695_EUMVA|nr:hypothetical protein EVAR_66157_1 [Eumeta japonica]